MLYNFSAQPLELGASPGNRLLKFDTGRKSDDINKTSGDNTQIEATSHCSNLNALSNKNIEIVAQVPTWEKINNDDNLGEDQVMSSLITTTEVVMSCSILDLVFTV